VEGSSVNEIGFGDVATKTEIDSLFLATVRLGYAFDPTLAYVKAGYASADVKLRGAVEFDETEVGFSSSERHFTLGGGFEYAWTKGAIFGLEYNRVDLGNATHVGFATVDESFSTPVPVRVEPDVLHVAMARLSLKFGDETAALPAVLK
jgi:outer membrane immunogenic protein